MAAGRLWVRRLSGGPWHHLKTEGGRVAACGARLPWRLDRERYQGLPHGYGAGTVCPACIRLVEVTPARTKKQKLACHIAEHHNGLPRGANRWTLDRLASWHHGIHRADTTRGNVLDHTHGGPLVGATNYPEGWDTGTDLIPRKDQP